MEARDVLRFVIYRRWFSATSLALLLITSRPEIARSGDMPPPPDVLAPAVVALPPPHIPEWIKEISPVGGAANSVQVRIGFSDPLVANVWNDDPSRAAVLRMFHIYPQPQGHFRFVTPRLVTFESFTALPDATRYRVTIDAGLRDQTGHVLSMPLAWTFETSPVRFGTHLGPEVRDLTPAFYVHHAPYLDPSSVAGRLSLTSAGDRVPLTMSVSDRRWEAADSWTNPQRPLLPGTTYTFVASPGVRTKYGNVESPGQIVGTVTTRAPLKLLRIENVDLANERDPPPRFAGGDPALVFNNFIDVKTLQRGVSFEPALSDPSTALAVHYSEANGRDGSVVRIDPAQLQPDTEYTVSVNAALIDNFGQHASPASMTFRTGTLSAAIDAPSGLTLVPLDAPFLTGTIARVPSGSARIIRKELVPDDLAYAGLPREALPDAKAWNAITVPTNGSQRVPLEAFTVPGTPGVTAFGIAAPGYTFVDQYGAERPKELLASAFIARTNLGLFVQSAGHSVLLRASRLDDGAPIAGAHVVLLPMLDPGRHDSVSPCDGGTTDPSGVWISGPLPDRCVTGRWWGGQQPAFTAIVQDGNDWTFLPLGNPIPFPFQFRIHPQWYGSLFTDRGVYRPGDVIHIAGVLYTWANGRPQPLSGRLKLEFDDKPADWVTPDEFGRIAATIRVPISATVVGSHKIVAIGSGWDQRIESDVTIAEPRIPNFTNAVTLQRAQITAGEVGVIRSAVRTFTGQPVPGAKVHFEYYALDTRISVGRFTDYHFASPGDSSAASGTDLGWAHGSELRTADATGTSDFRIPVPLGVVFPATYRITADASTANGEGTTSEVEMSVAPQHAYIGLAAPSIADAAHQLGVGVVAIGAEGRPRVGRRVVVRLERVWYDPPDPGDNDPHGNRYRHADLIASNDVLSATSPIGTTFALPGVGEYQIVAAFEPAELGEPETEVRFTAIGSSAAVSGTARPTPSLELSQSSYAVGDKAQAYITTPFEDSTVTLQVIGPRGVLWHETQTLHGSGTIEVPVSEEMVPNARIRFVAVQRGSRTRPEPPARTVATAFANFDVDYAQHVLAVRASGRVRATSTGPHASIHIDVSDALGNRTRAGCVVAIVDDAVLSLDGYRFAELAPAVFAKRDIDESVADNRLQPELAQHGWIMYSMGATAGMTGMQSTTPRKLRSQFAPNSVRPLAYFNAMLTTDAHGSLRLDVPLPSNATRWRVMVAASTNDARFGNAETTFLGFGRAFIVTRVRFLRSGDRVPSANAPLPANRTLDTPTVPEEPLFDYVIDGDSLSGPREIAIPSTPDGATLILRGAPLAELNEATKAMGRGIPDWETAGSYAFFDKRFLGWLAGRSDGYCGPECYSGTAYDLAHRIGSANAQTAVLLARLNAEAHDPVESHLCSSWDEDCIRRAELFALDALAARGVHEDEHLASLADTADHFTYSQQLMLAALLIENPKLRSRGENLAATLQASTYSGVSIAYYPVFKPEGEFARAWTQSAALNLALAEGRNQSEIDPILHGLIALHVGAGDPWDWSIVTAQALAAYSRRFQPHESTVSIKIDGTERPPAILDAKTPSVEIALPAAPQGHQITLEPHGALVSYRIVVRRAAIDGPGADDGFRITREILAVSPRQDSVSSDTLGQVGGDAPVTVNLRMGTIVAVGVRLVVDHPLNDARIVESIPAGLEAVDKSLPINRGVTASWDSDLPWGSQTRTLSDRIVVTIPSAEAGTYELKYLARVVSPGTFSWPAARADALAGTGDQGRTASATLTVR